MPGMLRMSAVSRWVWVPESASAGHVLETTPLIMLSAKWPGDKAPKGDPTAEICIPGVSWGVEVHCSVCRAATDAVLV